jgi:hypothetical protein
MVKKLWENHQYKALGFLKEILKKLDELSLGNIEFVKFINKSSFHARRLQINIEHLKKISFDPSIRSKKANIAICERALESSYLIIGTMNDVNNFDLTNWINRQEVCFQDSNVKNEILTVESSKSSGNKSKMERLKKYFKKEKK